MSAAIGFLFAFSTYGTHLHGAEGGSVQRGRQQWGAPRMEKDPALERRTGRLLAEPPLLLAREDRELVLHAIVDGAEQRGWQLHCAHVRTNHVHVVIQPETSAERALAYLKARATFALKARHVSRQRFWVKHGSTRYLWKPRSVLAAMEYVMDGQGEVMSAYESNRFAHGSE